MTTVRRPPLDRFMEKVEVSEGCWQWVGAKDLDGYPIFQAEPTRSARGHRWVYHELRGPIPTGMLVCHRCDNPSCVRPSHLFLGTAADNAHDRDSKGRTSTGERHYASKISREDVVRIRAMVEGGVKHRAVAETFGLSRSHVGNIARGRRWAGAL